MVQIIQICKRFLVYTTILLLSCLTSNGKNATANDFGNYLSWSYAKQSRDFKNLKDFFGSVNLLYIDKTMLEEILFQSVIFDDWKKAKEASVLIEKIDKGNISATFYSLVDDILNKKTLIARFNDSHADSLDINFIKAILLWTTDDLELLNSVSSEDCIPLLCLHKGQKLIIEKKTSEAENFFTKVEEKNFSSTRIQELLVLAFLELKKIEKAKKNLQKLSIKDLNNKEKKMSFISQNIYLLNPIKTQRDGVAEVLYNISSWYYQKNLFKYAIFFGKLSLKIRPNLNAARLLIVNAFNEIGFNQMALDSLKKINERNTYFMSFIKIKSNLYDEMINKQSFLEELKKLSQSYPENWEVKLLLADKLRALEKYKESIDLYTSVIENNLIDNKLPVLYSRGIAHERLDNWSEAEKDFKEALSINPNDPYILNYLGYSWLDRNMNLKDALELLEKAVKLEPNDGYIIDSLGWAFYLTGAFDKSIFYLEKAVSIMPNDATLNDHLGDAYWKYGRKKEAVSQWKRVLIIDPNFKNKNKVKSKINIGIK